MEFKYAPGLPGYGTQGIDGSNGLLGMAIYYSDFDGTTDATQITARLNENKILFSVDEQIPGFPERTYQNGDMFVDKNGRVYEIDDSVEGFTSTGSRLNTSTIFVEGTDTEASPIYTRYSNAFGTEKFLVDNVYASGTVNNYALAPESADGLYGIGAVDYGQIKYVDNSIGNYHPYTIWSNTNDVLSPEKAIALVKEDLNDIWHLGNLDGGANVRAVDLKLDFENVEVGDVRMNNGGYLIVGEPAGTAINPATTGILTKSLDVSIFWPAGDPLIKITNKSTSSAADAALLFSIPGDDYTMGIDNTDDNFKICYGTALADTLIAYEHHYSGTNWARYNKFYDNLEIEVLRDDNTGANDPMLILDANAQGGTPADGSVHTSMVFMGPARQFTLGLNGNTANDAINLYSGTSLPTSVSDTNHAKTLFAADPFRLTAAIGLNSLLSNNAKFHVFGRQEDNPSAGGTTGFSYGLSVKNAWPTTTPSNSARGIQVRSGQEAAELSTDNIILHAATSDGVETGYLRNTSGGGFALTSTSDRRRKIGIEDASVNALNILNNLSVREFWWRGFTDTSVNDSSVGNKIIGYIAQEANEVYPYMATYNEDDDVWGTSVEHLIPILHKAILEQQSQISLLSGIDSSTLNDILLLDNDVSTLTNELQVQNDYIEALEDDVDILLEDVSTMTSTIASLITRIEALEDASTG